jgi:hypothetical protein
MAELTGHQVARDIEIKSEGSSVMSERIREVGSLSELVQSVKDLSQSNEIKSTSLQDSLKKDFFTLAALDAGMQEFGSDFSKLNDSNVEHFVQILNSAVSALNNVEISQRVRELVNSQKNVKRFFNVNL